MSGRYRTPKTQRGRPVDSPRSGKKNQEELFYERAVVPLVQSLPAHVLLPDTWQNMREKSFKNSPHLLEQILISSPLRLSYIFSPYEDDS